MQKLHRIFASILIISLSIVSSYHVHPSAHAEEKNNSNFIEAFDSSRRYLAIDPSVTNQDLTTASYTLEKGTLEAAHPSNNEIFHHAAVVLPNGTLLSYASPSFFEDTHLYTSVDGLDFQPVINDASSMHQKINVIDDAIDPTDPGLYLRPINTATYDDNETETLLDDEIHILYRISSNEKSPPRVFACIR